MEPIVISVKDAARALNLGVTKIYELIGAGELQTIKMGTRRLVKSDSVRSLIERCEASTSKVAA